MCDLMNAGLMTIQIVKQHNRSTDPWNANQAFAVIFSHRQAVMLSLITNPKHKHEKCWHLVNILSHNCYRLPTREKQFVSSQFKVITHCTQSDPLFVYRDFQTGIALFLKYKSEKNTHPKIPSYKWINYKISKLHFYNLSENNTC